MRRRTVLAGAVTALVLVLTGCGSDNPKPSRPASSSASPSASPSAVAPTMPAEAKGTGPEAAKAFVKHYIATLNYAAVSGDTTGLRRLYSRSCTFCEGISDGFDRVHVNGGSIKTNGWRVRHLDAGAGSSAIKVLASVNVTPQVVLLKAGTKPKKFDGIPNAKRRFSLSASGGSWSLTNLEVVR